MGTIKENLKTWTQYNWYDSGDEWSKGWGSSNQMWYSGILPRISSYLPARKILEIAPGFGRCTSFLQALCDEMWIVDVTPRCLDACKKRFKRKNHIHYILNDGKSLDMLPDDTFDFVFSWDSLVHCDLDVVGGYLSQLTRVMKPDAIGFFHHSNLGAFPGLEQQNTRGWRSKNVSASNFAECCMESGMKCTSQEIIPWNSGDLQTDCLSVVTPILNTIAPENIIIHNPDFINEMNQARRLDTTYNFSSRKLKEIYEKLPLSQDYLSKIMNRKIVGWGAGEYFKESLNIYPFNLAYLVDMDDTKIGSTINGLNIFDPDTILKENPDNLFIAVFSPKYHKNVYQWLESHGYSYQNHFYYFDIHELQQMKNTVPDSQGILK